ncbi:MAG TPA: glycosyltransferase family 39 protein, partial [Labilithrix sp.]|nr:glycosyltransferase family 39 protein [Labilithrix sp.]
VDPARPLARRHGFWVVALGTVLGLPTLGSSGLVDTWETHYAEVARVMLERHDFVSPWWAHDGWFMSKPVLTFWLEAMTMAAFGVRTGPDEVLAGASGALARPEWAIRFPSFALALLGTYVLYAGVARTCGRRAGLFGAVVLWTMPGFALLSHQAITDMPLVAGVGGSLGLLLRALSTSDSARVTPIAVRVGRRELRLHAGHAAALAILLVTVPQILTILLQQVHVDASGLHIRPDRLVAGSPHACLLPGQPACSPTAIAHPKLTPAIQAAIWSIPTVWLVLRAASETRVARLFSLGAWMFAALAAMAKGPAGLVIPAAASLVCVLARRSIRPLLRLELLAGLLLAVVMIGPWYLAVHARHGRVFLDELVMRHMLGRTLEHLHDTNEGEDVGIAYFVRQLGYATFPWSGIALSAVFAVRADERSRRGLARALLFGAGLISFALVSSMRTKFHHYVFVALPPLAMLTGLQLDEVIAISASPSGKGRKAWAAMMMLAAACVALLVARSASTTADGAHGPARFVLLLTYRYSRAWPSTGTFALAFGVLGVLGGIATALGASSRLRTKAIHLLAAVAVVLSAVLLDLYLPRCANDGGQREVIAAYYRDRSASVQTPLVAYQLNWKGENFYTGNHLAIFVSSGAPMKRYLDRRRARPEESTVYFVTERSRVRTLQQELGAFRTFVELTSAAISAEFTLVRVEL